MTTYQQFCIRNELNYCKRLRQAIKKGVQTAECQVRLKQSQRVLVGIRKHQ